MENNEEWISVGNLRLRVRAPLPSIGVADWLRGVRFAFVVDGSRYAFLSPPVPLSHAHYMVRISLTTTPPLINPYQLDVLSLAVAGFAVRAFDIARHDAYLRSRRGPPGVRRGSQNPYLVIQVNVYSNAGGGGGGSNGGGSRVGFANGGSQVGRPSLQDGVLVLDALPLPPQRQGGRLVPPSQAPRASSVRGGGGIGISRLVSPMGGDRRNNGMFDDDITDLLDAILEQDGGSALGFGAVPASASCLSSLPSTLYSGSSAAADAEEQNCSICFEEMVAGDRVAELPCSHLFHTDCIVPWLQNSHLCPLCRHPLPVGQ